MRGGAAGLRVRRASGALMNQGPTWGLALLCAAGCVRVDTAGPNGIASARLESVPPSIVVGDVLRDVNGDATVLSAKAYDAAGSEVTTAPLRFVYVPSARDSLQQPVRDSALVVDSLKGTVTARSPFTLSQAVVAVRISDRLQILDTLDIVPAPDSAVSPGPAVTVPLRYSCADTARTIVQRPDTADRFRLDTLYAYNTLGPFRVLVRGDSAGTHVPIRRRLVRWTVDSGVPVPVPQVPLPGGPTTTTVPVVGIVFGNADRVLTADTTDASGLSTVRLRIRPSALGPSVIAANTFTVRFTARAQPGPDSLKTAPVQFRVQVQRDPSVACR